MPTLRLGVVAKLEPNSELNVLVPAKITSNRAQALREEEFQTERHGEHGRNAQRPGAHAISAIQTSRTNSLLQKLDKLTCRVTDGESKIMQDSNIQI